MKEKFTTLEMIARIATEAGVSKKVSTDLIRVLPEVIETGLERDGEVKVPGLGTFRLKWVENRTARNLKTGENVEVPAHSKVVFQPEKTLKEQVNSDFRYLTYQVLDRESQQPADSPRERSETAIGDHRDEPADQPSADDIPSQAKELLKKTKDEKEEALNLVKEVIAESEIIDEKSEIVEEEEVYQKKKMIYWVIPLLFVIVALLTVVFYMKNCQDKLVYPVKENKSQEQVIKPSEPVAEPQPAVTIDTVASRQEDTVKASPPQEPPRIAPVPPPAGFAGQQVTVTGGRHLFQIAREVYGNPYLWALIYLDNHDKITDPEQVLTGITLEIPSLEGTPDHLTRADSLRVAEGYRMLADYYKAKGDKRAGEFEWAVSRYSPK